MRWMRQEGGGGRKMRGEVKMGRNGYYYCVCISCPGEALLADAGSALLAPCRRRAWYPSHGDPWILAGFFSLLLASVKVL